MKGKHWAQPLWGFLFTAAGGTLLHFLYDWSGKRLVFAPFSGVNESVWEHMKLLFFPMVGVALLQSVRWRDKPENFWCGKLWSILLGLNLIPALYYAWNGALGKSPDWVNISIFFIAAGLAYLLEYHIFRRGKKACSSLAAVLPLVLLGVFFVIWTFQPPHFPLFQDPISGGYGISGGALG